jgi:hypothetical protein
VVRKWPRGKPGALISIVKEGFSRFIPLADFTQTFDVEILTFDGQVGEHFQIKWIFSNIMAAANRLILLHLTSQPKTEPDKDPETLGSNRRPDPVHRRIPHLGRRPSPIFLRRVIDAAERHRQGDKEEGRPRTAAP